MTRLRAAGLLAAILALGSAEPPQEPLPLDLEEHVDVQLGLVDVVVLDRKDRTVADLDVDDFDLLVDLEHVKIETFDVDCPAAGPAPAPQGAAETARYVLVFDYYHLERPVEALESAMQSLARLDARGEETMLVSLGQVLRIEVPFTKDAEEIRSGMVRMQHDLGLYGGSYGRLTERRFFDRIFTLFDVMGLIPGRKSVVLFSGPFLPDGFTYDPTFEKLAALSARVRTRVYTVDAGGFRTELGGGGPPMLRRLAHETGGRPTSDTNDLGLGIEQARHDAGCVYTLGFLDEKPRLDRSRWLRVFVRRPGHRAVHPTSYVVRSDEERARALAASALMLPQMFASDRIASDVARIRPLDTRHWEVLAAVAIAFDPSWPSGMEHDWLLQGRLRKPNGTTVHAFERRLQQAPPATVYESLRLRRGHYTLSVVLSHPELVTPLAAFGEFEIPGTFQVEVQR